jgi:hypothetical protein
MGDKKMDIERLSPAYLLAFAAALFLSGVSPVRAQLQAPVSCKAPLTEEQLSRLLSSGVADARVQEFVSQCGVDFEITGQTESQLQGLGASDAVLKLVRSASEKILGEKKRKAEEEQKHREEFRLSELRRTLGVDAPAVLDLKPNLTLDEARGQLVLLRAQTRDIETRLKTRYPNLDADSTITKDTFETTADYQARLAKAAADHRELKEAYKKDLGALTAAYNSRIADLLSRQYREPGLKAVLTKYNADKQRLSATLGSCGYWFEVAPLKAREFYAHQDSLEVKGNFLVAEERQSAATEVTLFDSQTQEELKSAGRDPMPDYADGFTLAGLSLNGAARLVGTRLRLTDDAKTLESASVFWNTLVDVQMFSTDFEFQLESAPVHGFTFVIQNVGARALGEAGGGLGYENLGTAGAAAIPKSVAVIFIFYSGSQLTGLSTRGESPSRSPIPLTDVKLRNEDAFKVRLGYDGKVLSMTITDTKNPTLTFSTSWTIDIPNTVASKTAYVGFTGGTGFQQTSTQEIINWTYYSWPAQGLLWPHLNLTPCYKY